MRNKPKPDNRRDNVDKIQRNIDNTIENYRLTEEIIEGIDEPEMKKDLMAKNKRREASLDGMKEEIRDEAIEKQEGYK